MGDHVVALAGPEHAARVAQLLHDFNTEYSVPAPDVTVLENRLARLLARPDVFAVSAGDPAIGCALVTLRPNVWVDGVVALLDELYVAPAHRNGGIGGRIIDLVLDEAERRGAELIEINVDEGDVDAQRFYDRWGFTMIDPGTSERAFYLYRELDIDDGGKADQRTADRP